LRTKRCRSGPASCRASSASATTPCAATSPAKTAIGATLRWQEAAGIQGGRRIAFNVDISRDGKSWRRKYRFETPDFSPYPSFHEHEGVIWLSVTQGNRGSTARIMEDVGQFAPQAGKNRKPPFVTNPGAQF
jgi:hypothetical protein